MLCIPIQQTCYGIPDTCSVEFLYFRTVGSIYIRYVAGICVLRYWRRVNYLGNPNYISSLF